MHGDVTPEEKLLKLIKEGAQSAPKSEPAPVKAATQSPPLMAPKPIAPHSNYLRKIIRQTGYLNWGLIGLFGLMLIYQHWVGRPLWPVNVRLAQTASVLNFPLAKGEKKDNIEKDVNIFNARNVFKSVGEPPPTNISAERSPSFGDRIRGLHLTGIVLGDQNQAVVEDRSNGQVHYVVSGDYIGAIQVVDVEENKVVIRFGDDEGELSL